MNPYRDNALPARTVRGPENIESARYLILALNLIIAATGTAWSYARIRSQPPERIVRVEVPVPGPVRVVEVSVPAPLPPRCEDSILSVEVSDHTTHRCTNGGILSTAAISDDLYFITCHCSPDPGGVRVLP